MRPNADGPRAQQWLRLFWLSAILTLAVGATLLPHLRDSTGLVKMRDARQAPGAGPKRVPVDPLVRGGIAAGEMARIRILGTPANAVPRESIKWLGTRWAIAAILGVVALIFLLLWLFGRATPQCRGSAMMKRAGIDRRTGRLGWAR